MAANNFFGNSSHGEATPYQAYVGAPPPPPPQQGYTAAPAVAGVPAGQVAAPGYARFQAPVTVAPAGNYRSATATAAVPAAVYTAYQPVPGGTPAAPYSSAPEGAAQVATAASYPSNTYQVYPPGPAPAVPAPAPAPGPGAQQPVFENPKGPVAAAAAATYYGQPRTSQAAFSMAEGGPHFQARPLYSTNSNVNIVAPPTVMSVGAAVPGGANRQPNPAAASSYSSIYSHSNSIPSYTYPAVPTMVNHKPPNLYVHSTPGASLTGAPVAQQVTQGQPAAVSTSYSGTSTNAWTGHRIAANPQQSKLALGTNKHGKIRPQPKPQPLHYCEVCKISCAGPQTYKEHLEGQKHRKKEAANKAAMSNGEPKANNGNSVNKSGVSNLRCELCNVTCTGSDAYAAHIRGSKHTKVMKLHSKLGKPIPSIDPIVVSAGVRNNSGKDDHHGPSEGRKKRTSEAWVAVTAENGKNGGGSGDADNLLLPDEKEIVPVGGDYIEEMKSENGKIVSFNCKLCDCKFNDPNAKVMHMKGRRHRLQYKKKVDPELVVDLKPSLRNRKLTPEEQQAKHKMANEEFWKRREEEFRAIEEEEQSYWEERKRFEDDKKSKHPGHPMGYHPLILRPETIDDRHVIAKHREIYPSDERLAFVQKHVSNVERALKLVSDIPVVVEQNGVKEDETLGSKDSSRSLRGVMRVGVLAKGLLLSTDENVDLVVLCSGKPSYSLLDFIVKHLPEKLKEAAGGHEYEVEKLLSEAAFNVVISKLDEELPLKIKVTLTSPSIRESKIDSDQADSLNKEKCLEALASLRRAKWFQARASGRQSCVMVTRVLRELCIREPIWRPMKQYTLELLVEKVLASASVPLSPGDAIRRVFESVASGLLLPNSPGLLDPCERDPQDSTDNFSPQERENITAYSQRALRLIAFRQINKVLGMESLPPPRFTRNRMGRKRKLESEDEDLDEAKEEATDEEQNEDITDAKKEKKDQLGDEKT